MIISDLNHLEVVTQKNDIIGGFNSAYGVVNFFERFDVKKDFNQNVRVYGHLATAESDAEAYGYGTSAQIFTYTKTTPYSSLAQGTSISASS